MRVNASRFLRPRLVACALLVTAVVLAPAASGDPSQSLRARDSALAAKSRAAALSLYAIETKLARARTQLTAIQGQAETLRRERQLVALRLQVARKGMRISQGRLATRLRALYEHGDVDPIAIVLGSQSLDAALTGLDSITQIANGDRAVIAQVHGARQALTGLQQRLADRQTRLDRLVAAAAVTERSLEGARASHQAYVQQLAGQRRMTEAAIAQVEEQARAARVKTQALVLQSAAPSTTPPVDPSAATPDAPTAAAPTGSGGTAAAPPTPAASGGRTLSVTATGYALPGRTATGLPVGWGVAAVDPSVIPLGSHFVVPGYGEAVAADIGGGVRGATIDLWFPTVAQAQAWGRRSVTISIG